VCVGGGGHGTFECLSEWFIGGGLFESTRIPFIFKMKFYLYSPRTALRPVATAQQILQMAFRYLRTMALWKR